MGLIFFYLDTKHLTILTPLNFNSLQIVSPVLLDDTFDIKKTYRTYGTFCILISLLIKIGVTPFHG